MCKTLSRSIGCIAQTRSLSVLGAPRLLDLEKAKTGWTLISAALTQTSGNQTRAAEVLQISRGGLIKRMKRLSIDPKGF